ncbi:DUF6167 family protein [Streptomyces pristinaespiralis]|jgi:hypothetical protein|uniref:Secreted protein n=2 Tax=Streptomyces pristinaespiralis TaxID=38300 RepID=B5HGS8_STRE2|nr:DUF6167 family protein [Streptomyces pristinaespiralis]ALC24370.1 Secreted protein [Streptomyces pristinaespiralis]EDY66039.1 secreted protein [Streptomyces pristinaespiralis ATCC 25486]QMU13272.1 hypothetical protein H3L99_06425 [Streptomyces pristinaespiralis]
MFRRTFWFTAGAAAGVWATTKVNRKLKQLTPESLAAQAANKAVDAGHKLKDFALDVRAGMVQREGELAEVLGLHASVDGELPAQRGRAAVGRGEPAQITYLHGGKPGGKSHRKHSNTEQPHGEEPHGEHSYNRNEDH